jgi:hypothetical protein
VLVEEGWSRNEAVVAESEAGSPALIAVGGADEGGPGLIMAAIGSAN